MGRIQVVGQGALLVQMEPGPALESRTRATLLPLVATLLLEAAVAPATMSKPAESGKTEGGDEARSHLTISAVRPSSMSSAYHGLDEHRRETGRTDNPKPLQKEDVRAA